MRRHKDSQKELCSRFIELIDGEQLFLTADLKLAEVTLRLGTNRTYLLAMLQNELHMTFSEFVNRRRIAYACQLRSEHPELTTREIAYASGYSTFSTFYRNHHKYIKPVLHEATVR